MKRLFTVIAVLGLTATAKAQVEDTGAMFAAQSTRPCVPKPNTAPTRMICVTGSDVDSGSLGAGGRCFSFEGDSDTWIRFGTAAVTTVANDEKFRAGKAYRRCFPARSYAAIHVSCMSVAVPGDWRIAECK